MKLTTLLLAAVSMVSNSMASSELGPQNVVLILADDVGVDLVEPYESDYTSYGHPDSSYLNTTPAIDYLAKTGLRFRNAWTNPVCSPTRSQILTGKHAHKTGVGRALQQQDTIGLGARHEMIPTVLRATGQYESAAVGKWHLAWKGDAQWFHTNGGFGHPIGSPGYWWFDRFAGSRGNIGGGESYNDWTKTYSAPLNPPNDDCMSNYPTGCTTNVTQYVTVNTADDAIKMIHTLPEPFFLYVAFNAAHTPLDGPTGTVMVAPTCTDQSGQPIGDPNCSLLPNDKAHNTRCLVQWMDNEIGRIVCAIETGSRAPEEETTIIFMGDNGSTEQATKLPFRSDHAKATMYEGGVKVPLIVKSPHVRAALVGGTTDAIVGSTDLFATIAELGSASVSADPDRESVSLMPLIRGERTQVRDYVFAERSLNFVPPASNNTLNWHDRAIRNRDGFKLLEWVTRTGGGIQVRQEFYDLNADPFESTDRLTDALNNPTGVYGTNYAALQAELTASYPTIVQ